MYQEDDSVLLIRLAANMVKGTNLNEFHEVCMNQNNVNTSRLEKMVDKLHNNMITQANLLIEVSKRMGAKDA